MTKSLNDKQFSSALALLVSTKIDEQFLDLLAASCLHCYGDANSSGSPDRFDVLGRAIKSKRGLFRTYKSMLGKVCPFKLNSDFGIDDGTKMDKAKRNALAEKDTAGYWENVIDSTLCHIDSPVPAIFDFDKWAKSVESVLKKGFKNMVDVDHNYDKAVLVYTFERCMANAVKSRLAVDVTAPEAEETKKAKAA